MLRRWHRPSWFAVLLLLGGVAAFCALGFWQLRRASEKEQLLASYAAAALAPAEDFGGLPDNLQDSRYPHVFITGHYLPERGYLLDAQVRDGRVGRNLIAVFAPNGSKQRLLVNRGWLAGTSATDAASAPALPSDEVRVQGIYAPIPAGGLRVGGNALAQQTQWPKLTLYLEPAALSADLDAPLYPRLLLLDAEPTSGLQRQWTPAIMPPERHRGYAFQWFSFAFAALAIFAILHFRKDHELKKP